MSIQSGDSSAAEPRLSTELDDGRSVDVEITGSPDNKRRIDIRVENGRHWVFAVQNQTAGLLMVLNENGQRTDDELPAWIEPTLQRLGLEGVEKA
ncbi:hypothetical protein [Halopiger xanaduensis]|uniref:Uncharacterized protein n=1 Tax=Halopiger xanaduensis (strain DSM 18323 / JCM 14033 / SH-6) TaxID=797210 RepID=F8D5L9_HALXS|nr:hypothetical protein [Halopiger xanaduensis]AEH38858.1 hypothetical protein Halxa_4256 [Halopiger xanaduensis SH-6]